MCSLAELGSSKVCLHSRDVFPGKSIGGVADQKACFSHSPEKNNTSNHLYNTHNDRTDRVLYNTS